MTFEEWIAETDSGYQQRHKMNMDWWRQVWNAAQATEREASAMVVDSQTAYLRKLQEATAPFIGTSLTQIAIETTEILASAIRARGGK